MTVQLGLTINVPRDVHVGEDHFLNSSQDDLSSLFLKPPSLSSSKDDNSIINFTSRSNSPHRPPCNSPINKIDLSLSASNSDTLSSSKSSPKPSSSPLQTSFRRAIPDLDDFNRSLEGARSEGSLSPARSPGNSKESEDSRSRRNRTKVFGELNDSGLGLSRSHGFLTSAPVAGNRQDLPKRVFSFSLFFVTFSNF